MTVCRCRSSRALTRSVPPKTRLPQVPFDVEAGVVHTVSYNDLGQMERKLAAHAKDVACVVMEPVIENLGIVLPDAGYFAGCASCATTTTCC